MTTVGMHRAAWALAVLALGFTSGCGGMPYEINDRLTASETAAINAALGSAEAASAYVSGTTALSLNDSYGSQMEYLAPDGRSYLWFPGQIRTTPGHWRVDVGPGDVPRLCFLYGANSYDPVQRTYGGSWECGPFSAYVAHLSQLAKGDPFGLSDGTAPFPMVTLPEADFMQGAQAKGAGKVSQKPLSFVFDRLFQ